MSNDIQEIVNEIKKVIGEQEWEWDSRFDLALVAFSTEELTGVLEKLCDIFATCCDSQSAELEMKKVKSILSNISDLNPGQYLLTSDLDSDPVFFAAWWPWGNGEKVSLRIGLYDPSRTKNDLVAFVKEELNL